MLVDSDVAEQLRVLTSVNEQVSFMVYHNLLVIVDQWPIKLSLVLVYFCKTVLYKNLVWKSLKMTSTVAITF